MTDATPALPPESLQEAFDLENDLPEVRTSEVSSPNFAKSQVAHVRLSAADLERTQQAAQASDRSVSDVIRAALYQYLHAQEIDQDSPRAGPSASRAWAANRSQLSGSAR